MSRIPVLLGAVCLLHSITSCSGEERSFCLEDTTSSTSELIRCIQYKDTDFILLGVSNNGSGADDVVLLRTTAAGDTCWISRFGSGFNDVPLGVSESGGSLFLLYRADYPDSGEVSRLALVDGMGLLLEERSISTGVLAVLSDDEGGAYLLITEDCGARIDRVSDSLDTIWSRAFFTDDSAAGTSGYTFAKLGEGLLVVVSRSNGAFEVAHVSSEGDLLSSEQILLERPSQISSITHDQDGGLLLLNMMMPLNEGEQNSYLLIRLDSNGSLVSEVQFCLPGAGSLPEILPLSSEELLFIYELNGTAQLSLFNPTTGNLIRNSTFSGNVLRINDAMLARSGDLIAVGSRNQTENVNHSAVLFSFDRLNPPESSDPDSCPLWNLVIPGPERLIYDPNNDLLLSCRHSGVTAISPGSGDTIGTIPGSAGTLSLMPQGGFLMSGSETFSIYDGGFRLYRSMEVPEGLSMPGLRPVSCGPDGLVVFGVFRDTQDFPGEPADEGLFLGLLGWDGGLIWSHVLDKGTLPPGNDRQLSYSGDCTSLGFPDQIVVAFTWSTRAENSYSADFYINSGVIRVFSFDMNGYTVWQDTLQQPEGSWYDNIRLWSASQPDGALLLTYAESGNGIQSIARMYNGDGDTILNETSDRWHDGTATRLFLADTLLGAALYSTGDFADENRVIEMTLCGETQRQYTIEVDGCQYYVEDFSITRGGDIVTCGFIFEGWDSLNEKAFAAVISEETTIRNH